MNNNDYMKCTDQRLSLIVYVTDRQTDRPGSLPVNRNHAKWWSWTWFMINERQLPTPDHLTPSGKHHNNTHTPTAISPSTPTHKPAQYQQPAISHTITIPGCAKCHSNQSYIRVTDPSHSHHHHLKYITWSQMIQTDNLTHRSYDPNKNINKK